MVFVTGSLAKSSRSQMFFKIGALKNFVKSTGKHPCWSLFLIKSAKVFSCEICKIFKNTFLDRAPPVAASALYKIENFAVLLKSAYSNDFMKLKFYSFIHLFKVMWPQLRDRKQKI